MDARTTKEVATPAFGRLDGVSPVIGSGLTIAVVVTTLRSPTSAASESTAGAPPSPLVLLDSRNGAVSAGVTVWIMPGSASG